MLSILLISSTQIACSQQVQSEESSQTNSVAQNLTLSDFYTAVKDGDVQLVDVRRPEEFAGGHAVNSININFLGNDFDAQISEQLSKDKPVYLYCASGNRSGKAMKALESLGFKEIYNLTGAGYKQWADAGYPIEN